ARLLYAQTSARGERCELIDPAPLSARGACVSASRQERHRGPARLVQVGPPSALREGPVIAGGEPGGLVGLPGHHQDIGMFMTHDFKAHGPLPPDKRA